MKRLNPITHADIVIPTFVVLTGPAVSVILGQPTEREVVHLGHAIGFAICFWVAFGIGRLLQYGWTKPALKKGPK